MPIGQGCKLYRSAKSKLKVQNTCLVYIDILWYYYINLKRIYLKRINICIGLLKTISKIFNFYNNMFILVFKSRHLTLQKSAKLWRIFAIITTLHTDVLWQNKIVLYNTNEISNNLCLNYTKQRLIKMDFSKKISRNYIKNNRYNAIRVFIIIK